MEAHFIVVKYYCWIVTFWNDVQKVGHKDTWKQQIAHYYAPAHLYIAAIRRKMHSKPS